MRLGFPVLIMLVALAAPARGQNGLLPYSNLKPAILPNSLQPSETVTRQVMSQYAACTLRLHRKNVERYLAMKPDTQPAKDLTRRILSDDCLRNKSDTTKRFAFQYFIYRGAIYGLLYRERFAQEGPVDFSAVAPLDHRQGTDAVVTPKAAERELLLGLADCAVRHGPAEGRALILSEIGSPEEKAAFASLTPHLSACMTDDLTLNFTRTSLRAFVGETLYRLSAAVQGDQKAD